MYTIKAAGGSRWIEPQGGKERGKREKRKRREEG